MSSNITNNITNNINNNNKNKSIFSNENIFKFILTSSIIMSIIIIKDGGNCLYELFKCCGNFSFEMIRKIQKLLNCEYLEKNKNNEQSEELIDYKDENENNEENDDKEKKIDKTFEINNINNEKNEKPTKKTKKKGNDDKEKKDQNIEININNENNEENEKEDNTMFNITFLGRLIITYYSIYGVIFIYNFAIQILILIPGKILQIDNKSIIYIHIFLYFFYSIFYSIILVIPTYEFFSFPFLRFKDPLSHLWTFKHIFNDEEFKPEYTNKSNKIINGCLILIELFYFISFILGIFSNNLNLIDIFNFFILFIIYIFYLTIFFSYCFIVLILWLKKLKNVQNINEKSLPEINLISYFIDISEKENKNSSKENESNFYYILLLLQIIFFIIIIIYFIFCLKTKENSFTFLIYFLFGFVCSFKFPLYFGIKREKKPKNSKMIFFISCFCLMICTIISCTLIYILYLKDDYDDDDVNEFERFENIRPSQIDLDKNKNTILPSICSASVYNIPIISYIPFINDAYYYKKNHSSLDFTNYRNIFFKDSEYEITLKRSLIKDKEKKKTVKMIQYNLESPSNNVTILSIKGTSYNSDIYLDIQLYTPSVFLNLLLEFSIFMKLKESRSFHFLEYGLSIPYRLFFKDLIIDDYIKVLNKTYHNHSEFHENKVVIVGHSLGGGLSKILGKMVKKPSISLSGPGANAFHSLWGEEGIIDNFDITTIDLVPDMDLVPRVEVSGGTIYRIICREGPLGCHSKDLSLCEVLIMCQKPSQIVCEDIADLKREDIEKIKEASKLFDDPQKNKK